MPTIFRDPIQIAGLTFNQGPDADGVTWVADVLTGWEDTPGLTRPRVHWGYSDGDIVADRAPLSSRFLVLGGAVAARDRLAAEHARHKLRGALDGNRPHYLARYGPISMRMLVHLYDSIEIPADTDTGVAFRFQVPLEAPWPFKTGLSPLASETAGVYTGGDYYRTYPATGPLATGLGGPMTARTYDVDLARHYFYETATSGGAGLPTEIRFTNEGNAPAYPVFKVTGPLPAYGWQLVNYTTGEALQFGLDLSSGATLELNTLTQEATLSGTPVGYYVNGDWPTAQPGENEYRIQTAVETAATLSLEVYNTWR